MLRIIVDEMHAIEQTGATVKIGGAISSLLGGGMFIGGINLCDQFFYFRTHRLFQNLFSFLALHFMSFLLVYNF